MSATRCSCLWAANPYVLVVKDPDCRAAYIHIVHPSRQGKPA